MFIQDTWHNGIIFKMFEIKRLKYVYLIESNFVCWVVKKKLQKNWKLERNACIKWHDVQQMSSGNKNMSWVFACLLEGIIWFCTCGLFKQQRSFSNMLPLQDEYLLCDGRHMKRDTSSENLLKIWWWNQLSWETFQVKQLQFYAGNI